MTYKTTHAGLPSSANKLSRVSGTEPGLPHDLGPAGPRSSTQATCGMVSSRGRASERGQQGWSRLGLVSMETATLLGKYRVPLTHVPFSLYPLVPLDAPPMWQKAEQTLLKS